MGNRCLIAIVVALLLELWKAQKSSELFLTIKGRVLKGLNESCKTDEELKAQEQMKHILLTTIAVVVLVGCGNTH